MKGEPSGKWRLAAGNQAFILRTRFEPRSFPGSLTSRAILFIALPWSYLADMSIFRLKQLASTSVHAAADAMRWNYDRAELIADGVVHGIGVCFGLIAATVLIVLTAIYATALDVAVVSVYVAGLLAMLVLSATYNLWPVSRAKWVLRRFDHSAIYLLIAATYTPFIMELKENMFAVALLVGVWCVAIVGIVLKLLRPGRFDRLSVGLYLAMGWSGLMLYHRVVAALPTMALGLRGCRRGAL